MFIYITHALEEEADTILFKRDMEFIEEWGSPYTGHTFMASTKNDQFCDPSPSIPKMNNKSILLSMHTK